MLFYTAAYYTNYFCICMFSPNLGAPCMRRSCLILAMHVFPYMQYWCLLLLVEIQHLDSHTLWHVMSVLPVESLVTSLCSGWVLAALPPLLLVETSLWAVPHPTLSSSTHCVSPMLDSTPARLLLEVTLGQPQSWWRIFQVCMIIFYIKICRAKHISNRRTGHAYVAPFWSHASSHIFCL